MRVRHCARSFVLVSPTGIVRRAHASSCLRTDVHTIVQSSVAVHVGACVSLPGEHHGGVVRTGGDLLTVSGVNNNNRACQLGWMAPKRPIDDDDDDDGVRVGSSIPCMHFSVCFRWIRLRACWTKIVMYVECAVSSAVVSRNANNVTHVHVRVRTYTST